MSSINDALKRAKKSQKQEPPPLPPGAPPLPLVEPPANSNIGWFVLIILIIAIACFFIGLAFANSKPTTETTVTVTNVVQAAAKPTPPVPVVPAPAPVTNAIIPPPKPAPPALKLEGIFYGPTQQPQAIVNGQTVYVGDTVNGFRVKVISKNNVSLVASDGTEKNLVLGE